MVVVVATCAPRTLPGRGSSHLPSPSWSGRARPPNWSAEPASHGASCWPTERSPEMCTSRPQPWQCAPVFSKGGLLGVGLVLWPVRGSPTPLDLALMPLTTRGQQGRTGFRGGRPAPPSHHIPPSQQPSGGCLHDFLCRAHPSTRSLASSPHTDPVQRAQQRPPTDP